jgi:predicted ATPase
VLSHQRLGLSNFYHGKPAEALEHLQESIALYDPTRHRPLAVVYGQDMGVVSRIYTGLALATAGPPGEARDQIRSAVADARAGGHPHTLAFALCFAGLVSQMLQDRDAVGAYSEEALAEARGFPLWRSFGKVLRGWVRAVSDEASDAVNELQAGLAELSAIGTVVGLPFFLSLLAEVQWRRGGADERALETLATALTFSRAHDSPYWEAELLRLEGEVRRARGEEELALALFQRAVATSQKQGAHMLALRAATSAGRLLVTDGQIDAARSSIEPLLAPFAGGGASGDVDAARHLRLSRTSVSVRRDIHAYV